MITKGIATRSLWIVAAIFFASIVLLGGSSRHDLMQVIAMRPVAILCVFFALAFVSRGSLREHLTFAILLFGFILWTFVQLVPLPPGLWHGLPGREAIIALDKELLGQSPWRPISLSPTTGWSAFASLAVPAAALLFAVVLRLEVKVLLGLVALLGLLNLVFAFLQIANGGADALQFYRVSNRGAATGLFANENHMGVFLALTLLVVAKLLISAIKMRSRPIVVAGYGFALPAVFLAILMNGSRAGVALGILAALGVLLMFWFSAARKPTAPRSEANRQKKAKSSGFLGRLSLRSVGFSSLALVFVGLFAAFVTLERIPGIESGINQDPLSDLRWQLIAPLSDMAATHWLFGTGMGSFAFVYFQFEPVEMARPVYVNQAHNDWFQFVIEGGLPAVLLFIALAIYVAKRILKLVRLKGFTSEAVVFWLFVLSIIAAASAVDYPLRTGIFQVSLVWLFCALTLETQPNVRTEGLRKFVPANGRGQAR